jgi:glycosyltransferase involved in cell wall biosynthesis
MRLTVANVAFSRAPVRRDAVGGAEQVVAMLDAALVAVGHRSIVVARADSEVAGELRAEIPRDADVVHFHGLDFDRWPVDGGAIVTVHLPPSFYAPGALTRSATYVCVSESERAQFPGDAVVIPNGIDLDAFAPSDGGDSLVCLGRICEEKGFHDAVDAAKRADDELLIAGHVFDYDAHQRYFAEVLKPKLDARRRFIGAVGGAAKRELLANARAVLIPSRVAETSSLVAMEALASGTPVIAYRSGALPEIVDDGVTGFIVDDVDGLVRAIADVERIDRGRCRAEAEQRFDARRMIARYLALYADKMAACSS